MYKTIQEKMVDVREREREREREKERKRERVIFVAEDLPLPERRLVLIISHLATFAIKAHWKKTILSMK